MKAKFFLITALALWPSLASAMGNEPFYYARIDGDVGVNDSDTVYSWDGAAWVGGDVNKLYVTAQGEADEHEVESAEAQILLSRMIAPFWDVQAGVRHDFEPGGLSHAVLGVQGLAPYLFEMHAAGFLSEDGDLSARAEVEYELLLTQRLILSPDVEVNAYASDIPELEVASGIATVEANLRLRYEITRKVAPYVEVTYERAFGGTADLRRAAGGDVEATIVRAGVRVIF